eukprot:TRINITY_DN22629_c0_g1_i1.p1 TRINITY_DN22629_c0_g1~~TRINITY_DN22629_c0_g1_i1.p1  ORF type:complete len:257 (+),score=71.49 TRINITY_DN22629_c0_g1_i1:181-951(+)
MSSQRGNVTKGAPKYQNKFAFKHNKNSQKTEKILSLPNDGLCVRCTGIIEWKKKYRKYKPLTAARKCAKCEQKSIKRAYHVVCDKCALAAGVCAKCLEPKSIVTKPPLSDAERVELESRQRQLLAAMPERQRRTFYRRLAIDPAYQPGDPWTHDDDDADSDADSDDDQQQQPARSAARQPERQQQRPGAVADDQGSADPELHSAAVDDDDADEDDDDGQDDDDSDDAADEDEEDDDAENDEDDAADEDEEDDGAER